MVDKYTGGKWEVTEYEGLLLCRVGAVEAVKQWQTDPEMGFGEVQSLMDQALADIKEE